MTPRNGEKSPSPTSSLDADGAVQELLARYGLPVVLEAMCNQIIHVLCKGDHVQQRLFERTSHHMIDAWAAAAELELAETLDDRLYQLLEDLERRAEETPDPVARTRAAHAGELVADAWCALTGMPYAEVDQRRQNRRNR